MNLLSVKLGESLKGSCAVHQNEVVELQDDFARLTQSDLREVWATLDRQQRRTFIWVAFKVLSEQEALNVVRATLIADERNEYLNALDEREREQNEREDMFRDGMAHRELEMAARERNALAIFAKVDGLTRERDFMVRQVEAMRSRLDASDDRAAKLQKYERALATLKDAIDCL